MVKVTSRYFDTHKEVAEYCLLEAVQDDATVIHWLFRSLSRLDRKIVRLRFGFYRRKSAKKLVPYKVIADKMGKSESYLRKRTYVIIKRLRKLLKEAP